MPNIPIVPLHELVDNQEADFFALLSEKELLKTKEGKPYLRVAFRDANREVRFPVWSDSGVYKEFRNLRSGVFCKVRAIYRAGSTFGPQLDIRKIRAANDDDIREGFDAIQLRPQSPLPLEGMFDELQAIAAKQLGKGKMHNLVTKVFKEHRAALLTCVAARRHHHCYVGGLLEHTLSVTKIAVGLIDHFDAMYPERKGEVSRELVVAGAILHDIGKVREYEPEIGSLHHSTEGELIGHALLGRDIVRDAGKSVDLDAGIRVRLEHIVLSHQRFPDWGAAKPPMSLEAVIVHTADSCDALVDTYRNAFAQNPTDRETIPAKNIMGYSLLKPPPHKESESG